MRAKNNLFYVNFIYALSAVLSTLAVEESPPTITKQSTASEILFAVPDKDDEPGEPFTIECNATGNPPPGFRWEKNGKFFHWHHDYPRIFQAPSEGTIVITNPKNSDEGHYQCIAENHRGIAISNPVLVRRTYLKSSANTTPLIVYAVEGQPTVLSCKSFDGYPKPSVMWVYDVDNTMTVMVNTPRITSVPWGTDGNLYFTNITSEDCGPDTIYWCVAEWTFMHKIVTGDKFILKFYKVKPISHKPFELAPRLLYPSKTEQIGFTRQEIELCCIFGGAPLPRVDWLKDGKLLRVSNRVKLRNFGKNAIIKSLAYDDCGNYTCIASNGVGEEVSFTIRLEVMETPFFTLEPKSVKGKIGETAVISCNISGRPSPQLQWTHNGELVSNDSSSRYKYSPYRLEIYDLRKSDIGNYGCNASNDYGYVYKEVRINMVDLEPKKPWITTVRATLGETVYLLCNESSDSQNFTSPFSSSDRNRSNPFTWRKNGKPINYSKLGSRVYASSLNGVLYVSNSQISDSDIYTCFYNDTDSNNTSAMRSNITLVVQDIIGDPFVELRADCNLREATIEWHRGPNFTTITCYSLQRNDDDDDDDDNDPLRTNTWVNITDCMAYPFYMRTAQLYPAINTSFRVLAKSINGEWGSSDISVCVGESDIPYKNPKVFPANENEPKPGELVISWTPVRKKERNGPDFYYDVLWKKNQSHNNDWNVAKISDWKTGVFRIENQPPYQAYTVKVIAANMHGHSNDTVNETIVYSGEDVPTAAPSNLTLEELLPDDMSARVSWLPVRPDTVKGLLKGYRIHVRSGSNVQREIEANSDVTETIIPLSPDEENHILISVFNGRYSGPLSDVLIINNCGPPKSVLLFGAEMKNISGLRLSWIPPARLCSSIDLYTIYYRAIISTNFTTAVTDKPNSSVTLSVPANQTSAEIYGLRPATTYHIGIIAINKAGNGEQNWIDYTMPATELRFSRPLVSWYSIISDIHDGYPSIRVGWTVDQNHLNSSFYVKYKIRGDKKFNRTPIIRKRSVKIGNLKPGDTYEFVVVSVNGKVEIESSVKYVNIGTGKIYKKANNFLAILFFALVLIGILFSTYTSFHVNLCKNIFVRRGEGSVEIRQPNNVLISATNSKCVELKNIDER